MKYRSIVASLLLVSSAPVLGAEAPAKQPGRWAQDYTGRKADPSVRFGTLPNGLRYAIMHNETPSDGVAMRMRIGAGSLEERDEEQGVVLSEERLRDGPQYRMIKANLSTILDGTRVVTRWPIGLVDTIKAANHDRLARFYRANYRPDNATLVIVGNIDPAAVEQKILS